MVFDAIVVQGHIAPDLDPQGVLYPAQKLEMFNTSLKHLRSNNPDSYIILTGHGVFQPDASSCDWVYWEDQCRPLDHNGYVKDMPAQYHFVDIGLEQASKVGAYFCLKTRADCIIQRSNVLQWCHDILLTERKQILLTQQTGQNRIGDCFMYGATKNLIGIWDRNRKPLSKDGLLHIGGSFDQVFGRPHNVSWLEFTRSIAAFRDVHKIPFIDLRWNYHTLKRNGEWDKIMANALDVRQYHWGRANEWHIFDENDNQIKVFNKEFWSEKEFYGK